MEERTGTKDVFTFEVVQSLMRSIAKEMGQVLQRTSFHPIFSEVLDFSTALFNARGEMAAQHIGSTSHLGSMELCIKPFVNKFGFENLKPDDVLVFNDPFIGACHLPDIDIMVPIFYEGKLVSFAVSTGHHGDIGGMHPGSYAGDTTSIFQEGLRIPPLKLYDKGKLNEGVKDIILANVRIPSFTWGDLQAQIAACRIGEKRMRELFEKYGVDTIQQTMEWGMDRSEELMRRQIERIPDGTYTFADYLDNDGIDKDKEIKIHVKITVKGSNITFDYSGSDPQVKGPANCVFAVVYAATYTVMWELTDPTIPINHGCYRPITIVAPLGLVINAKFPSPVVSGNTETSLRMIDTVTAALAKVMPKKVIASDVGTTGNLISGGTDPRRNELYAFYLSMAGGWGARATKDGFGPNAGGRIGGGQARMSQELFEVRYPFFTEEVSLVPDSGGPGKFRGGVTMQTKMHPVEHTCDIGGCFDRSVIPPYGLFGGMPGLHGDNYVFRENGEVVQIDRGNTTANPGDLIYLRAPGGGGYGNPLDRGLDYLQYDITCGYVSVESARRDYGAVVDESTLKIDRKATEENREKLKGQWRRDDIFIDQKTKPFARREFRIVRIDEKIE